MVNLNLITLTNNRITTLGSSLRNLKRINSLFLAYNNLTTLDIDTFANVSVSYLDISYNQLDDSRFLTRMSSNLQVMHLNNNKLPSFPILVMPNLSFLELNYNQISALDSNVFDQLSNILNVYLSNNPISKSQPDYVRNLCNATKCQVYI